MKLLATVLFVFLLTHLTTAQTRQADSLILVDIYNSLDGPNWANPSNWLSDSPLEEWRGVRVQDDRVTSLTFINQNPKGVFPRQVLDLDQLHTLEFRGVSEVTGSIPADLVQLSKLSRFSVSGCELSGEVPNIFTQFPDLSTLILRDNNFEGPLPDIPNGLSLFYAEGNNFSGPIPDSWIDNDIGTLNISDNSLTGSFSDVLQTWSQIRQLYLSDNDWAPSSFPTWLGEKQGLVRFQCKNCNLTGELPANLDLSNLDSYAQIILDGNDLSGDVSLLFPGPNAFNSFYFSIGGNNFAGEFPAHLIRIPSSVDIRDNDFTSLTSFADSISFGTYQITDNRLNYEALEPVRRYIELDSIVGVQYGQMQMTMTADTITISEPTTLTVIAGDLHPSTTYEWTGPGLEGQTNASLELFINDSSNEGVYRCTMKNEIFPDLSLRRNDVVVIVDIFTSVQDNAVFDIKIYPNPTADQIQIDLQDASISKATYHLLANDGRVISNGIFSESQTIDMQDLQTGVYSLMVEVHGILKTHKIIKL